MNKIKFEQNPKSFTKDSAFVVHQFGIENMSELLNFYFLKLSFPSYFGFNWDALYDCLSYLDQIKEHEIIIVHDELPRLEHDNLVTYINLLNDAASNWKENEEHVLEIIFPIDCVKIVEELLNRNNQN